MSSTIQIRDFLIKMGFDGAEVEKGLNDLEKTIGKFNKKLSNSTRGDARKSVAKVKSISDVDAALKKQNATIAKQTSLKKVIDRLDKAGVKGLGGLRNSSRGQNPVKLESARVKAVEMLRVAEKELRIEKVKAAKAAERVARANERAAKAASVHAGVEKLDKHKLNVKKPIITANKNIGPPLPPTEKFKARRESFGRRTDRAERNLPQTGDIHASLRGELDSIKRKYTEIGKAARRATSGNQLKRMADDMRDVNDRASTMISRSKKVTRSFTAQQFAVSSLRSSLTNLSRSYISLFAIAGAGIGTISLGQELMALKASLLGASGSSVQAAADLEYIKETSLHLGNSLTESAAGFAKMGTAARAAGLGTQDARDMFMAASEAAAAFNLSGAESQGVFRAFSQILSKGKLSTEELLQLGERIPIAFTAAADALGVSTEKLFKQIESGKIRSVEFLPNFSKSIRKYISDSGQLVESLKTSRVALGRFKTSFSVNVMDAFEAGADEGLAEFFRSLQGGLEKLNPLFKVLGRGFGFLMKLAGGLIRVLSFITTPFQLAARAVDNLSASMDGPVNKMGALQLAAKAVYEAFGLVRDIIYGVFGTLDIMLDALYDKLEKGPTVDTQEYKDKGFFEKFGDKQLYGNAVDTLLSSVGLQFGPQENEKSMASLASPKLPTSTSTGQVNNYHTWSVDATDPEKTGEDIKKAFDSEMDEMVTSSFATGY